MNLRDAFGGGHVSAFRRLGASRFRELLELVPLLWLKTAVMVTIGILSGLSEMIAITLLVSLVFVLGQQSPSRGSATAGLPLHFGGLETEVSKPILTTILVCAILIRILLGFANSVVTSKITHQISQRVRHHIYTKILTIPFQRFQNYERSDLMNVIVTESYSFAAAHASLVRLGINFGTMLVFGAGIAMMAWPIALLGIVFGIVHNFTLGRFSSAYRRAGSDALVAVEALTQLCWTTLQTIKVVKSFGLEERHKDIFQTLSVNLEGAMLRSDRMEAATSLLSEALTFGIILSIILSAQFLPVDFTAALSATILLYRLQPHIKEFDSQLLKLHSLEASLQNVLDVMDEKEEFREPAGTEMLRTDVREIVFHDVSFRYRGSQLPAVRNASFSIKTGETTAVIGPSGSGKTTVLNMLLYLIHPTEGSITVDGMDLATISRSSWLRLLSVSGQDVELMEGTVLDNIRFRRDITVKDVRRAADLACATEFIEKLPFGFEEWLGDEAIRLSGGQRQRIGLARAIASRPDILLLDEATSSLDEVTEARVLSHLIEEFEGRTLIVVSHRPAVAALMSNQVCLSPVAA